MGPHPHCRIRAVRLKDGANLEIVRLKDGNERTYVSIMLEMRDLIDEMRARDFHPAGFAIVAWSGDAASFATARAYPGSPLPAIMVPDFVRERLMTERIRELTAP